MDQSLDYLQLKITIKNGAFIESWVLILKISPVKTQKKNFPQKPLPDRSWPQKSESSMAQPPKVRPSQLPGAWPIHHPMINSIPSRTLDPPGLGEQLPMSIHCNGMKTSSYRCSMTWKSRWQNNKPYQTAIGAVNSQPREFHPWAGGVEAAQRPTPGSNIVLKNNQWSTQSESEPKVGGSPDLRVLDKLIQRQIVKAKLQGHPMPSVAKVLTSPSPKIS